jgi:uncharacterized protein (DUF2249 family)
MSISLGESRAALPAALDANMPLRGAMSSAAAGGEQPRAAASRVETVEGERVVDVREIAPRIRHTLILQLFEHLDAVGSLQLIVDHDPRPLRLQLEAKHGSRCRWSYLEQGPDVWRVRLRQGDGGGGT